MKQLSWLDGEHPLNERGVKERLDGKGDAWANLHRKKLSNIFHMQDWDGVFGQIVFAENTGERIFHEYVLDDYRNSCNLVRNMALVALFDRKKTIDKALNSKVSTAFYLKNCRVWAEQQPIAPRFFFVIGGQVPP